MFKRVAVSVVGVPFLILVLYFAPEWVTMLLVAGMCAVGAWELLRAVRGQRGARLNDPFVWAVVYVAAMVPVLLYCGERSARILRSVGGTETPGAFLLLAALLLTFVLLLFVYAIIAYGKGKAIPFADVTAAVFAGAVFPLMLSCLLLLRMMPSVGKLLVFLPLCISFGSDTCAFFAGMLFGKHKLTPVSPKKTVEGAIGGLVGGVFGMTIMMLVGAAVLKDAFLGVREVLLFGIIGSAISQIGDLSFSVIKREFGVKDYGNLLPGHGGILDRFDSVTFVTPFVWVILRILWQF